MSGISSLGVGAGLDLGSLLDSLRSSERSRLQPISQQISSTKSQISAFGQLKSTLESFQSAAQKLSDGGVFDSFSAKVSGSALTAETSENASAGRYDVTVSQLARAQSLATSGQASTDGKIGTGTFTISQTDKDGVEPVKVTIDDSNNSLKGIRDAINASNAGVTASLVNDGDTNNPWRLVLTSKETGENAKMSITASDSNGGTGLSDLLGYDADTESGNMQETVAARNALLNVNGIAITSQSNTVKGAIQGVDLTLNETTDEGESSRIDIGRDDEGLKKAVKDFVAAWNTMDKNIDKLTTVSTDGDDVKGGVLTGNATVRSIQSALRNEINERIGGEGMNYLFEAGISFSSSFSADKRGQLEVDESKLDQAIANNPNGLRAFFAGNEENPGLATKLDDRIDQMLDSDGAIARAESGLNSLQDRLEVRGQRMQESIDATIERYRTQFQQLDSIMSRMNSTQSYLTQQLGMLNNQSSGNN